MRCLQRRARAPPCPRLRVGPVHFVVGLDRVRLRVLVVALALALVRAVVAQAVDALKVPALLAGRTDHGACCVALLQKPLREVAAALRRRGRGEGRAATLVLGGDLAPARAPWADWCPRGTGLRAAYGGGHACTTPSLPSSQACGGLSRGADRGGAGAAAPSPPTSGGADRGGPGRGGRSGAYAPVAAAALPPAPAAAGPANADPRIKKH